MEIDCTFCKIANHEITVNIVYEDELICSFLDSDPINEGHILIIPKKHFLDADELDQTTASAIMNTSVTMVKALKNIYKPEGYSIMQNGGKFNDTGHYHMHVFPRYTADGFGWTYGKVKTDAILKFTETCLHIKRELEKIKDLQMQKNGVVILTGPSGCGKGEIAKALSKFLSIGEERHLSMGSILRNTLEKADKDTAFKSVLAKKYGISDEISIFDPQRNRSEIIRKAKSYTNELKAFLRTSMIDFSQLDWLRFCVNNGLLVPDEWTEKLLEAAFETTLNLESGIIILDGYPRTVNAAEHLLKTLERLNLPVIRVLHLFITKEEMVNRALLRKRSDDTRESLDRRYQFYIDRVQPCIDYMKARLGNRKVSLIDAHQPVYTDGNQDIAASIRNIAIDAIESLSLSDLK